MKKIWELVSVFAKIGLFTFGGGYAMLPLLQAELVDKRKWLTDEKLVDYFCIGQSTPGIIAVNVATFVGYGRKGVTGAVAATVALVLPPIIVILLLANVLQLYMANKYVADAFEGIRIVVVALILDAVWKLKKTALKDRLDLVVFAVSLGLIVALHVSPALLVALAGVFGYCRYLKQVRK